MNIILLLPFLLETLNTAVMVTVLMNTTLQLIDRWKAYRASKEDENELYRS